MEQSLNKVCKGCGVEKPYNSEHFEKGRNYCRECRNKYHKSKRKDQMDTDIVMYKCKQMACSAHARVLAPCREDINKNCYKNIIEPFGFKDIPDMTQFLYNNFYNDIKALLDKGDVPSVDRIDTCKGYTPTNVRILSFKENTERGLDTLRRKIRVVCPNGAELMFNSVRECGDYFGYKPTETSRISGWCKGKSVYRKPEGYTFEYI